MIGESAICVLLYYGNSAQQEEAVVTQITNYVTGDAAFAVDQGGVIVLWNSAAEKTLGYSASTALGQHCWELLCGQDTYGNQYCCERCPLRQMAFRHESVHSYQATFKTAHSGRKQYAISCLVVFDASGNELLLHMLHPDKESLVDGNKHVTSRNPTEGCIDTLTRRETEALALLADGKGTSQIASRMGISKITACNHIQHVLNKLHAHTRLEAVILGKHFDLT